MATRKTPQKTTAKTTPAGPRQVPRTAPVAPPRVVTPPTSTRTIIPGPTSLKTLPPPVAPGLTHPAALPPSVPGAREGPVRDSSLIIFGGALFVVGVTAFILLFTLPWYHVAFDTPAGRVEATQDRSDINADTAYHHVMVTWPFVSLLALGLLGGVLAVSQFMPSRLAHVTRRVLATAWGGIAVFGFLVLVAGFRLLAAWILFLAGDTTDELALLASPWIIIGVGLALAVTSLFLLAPEVGLWWSAPTTNRSQRLAAVTAMVAAGFLLVSPFLPNLSMEVGLGGDRQVSYINEWTLADSNAFLVLKEIGSDLNWTRLMVWFLGGLSLASIGLESLRTRTWIPGDLKPMLRTFYLAAIPVLVGGLFTILYYVHLSDVTRNPTFSVGLNHLPALAFPGFIVLYTVYVMDSLKGASVGTPAPA